ncbi:MAG: AAA family ATPase [Microbacteriaceae bacterium]|nr:AAA family ATPase [Microbacteriaceae bacterium]
MSAPNRERLTREDLAWSADALRAIGEVYSSRMVGQTGLRETLLIGLLTGGHILLESVPGLAKTTAAQTLAQAVSGSFVRIQCTPDLLPSDIVGTQIYDASKGAFETQLGPVHANIVLLDEINRSSAKTQSAMLEAMQEKQTSIGGVTHRLPEPFLVLATQNPIEQEGTYPLPEAQLDRFMFKDILEYPTPAEEAEILARIDAGIFEQGTTQNISLDAVRELQKLTKRVYIDDAVIEYIVSLVFVTRNAHKYLPEKLARLVEVGASPRATINFAAASRAAALIQGRDHVIPEDVRQVSRRILRHRVTLSFEAEAERIKPDQIVDAIVAAVRTP